jgi:ribonuclease HII
MQFSHEIGIDENGLGAQLGPLVVTGVLAEVTELGRRTLRRKLPKAMRADLDDSKRLVSHADYALGEAWARALIDSSPATPEAALDALLLEGRDVLTAPCPKHVRAQCWNAEKEVFTADDSTCRRVVRHREGLLERGVRLISVRTSVICTKRLNDQRERGINRFVADLHAMERLILEFRRAAGAKLSATCGKVGGIGAYGRFFGPLSGQLHTALEEGQAKSSYYFPQIGELHFVRDADAANPLVMLASLIGKYVRELLMARISRFHAGDDADPASRPSGYHDPVSHAFVARTALARQRLELPDTCFERARELEA